MYFNDDLCKSYITNGTCATPFMNEHQTSFTSELQGLVYYSIRRTNEDIRTGMVHCC